jgi:hypothetical protein
MSFFNLQGIPESVLRSYARSAAAVNDENNDKEDADDNADSEFDDNLEMLRAYSLVIATAESDIYEMH